MTQLVRFQTQKRINDEVAESDELKPEIQEQDERTLNESSNYLRQKAYTEALRDLERRKTQALAIFR
ncbi:MAG: hypothetical protein ACFFEF_02085 [Candidatus Thorarchaeota archaeon]